MKTKDKDVEWLREKAESRRYQVKERPTLAPRFRDDLLEDARIYSRIAKRLSSPNKGMSKRDELALRAGKLVLDIPPGIILETVKGGFKLFPTIKLKNGDVVKWNI